jgi:hypothetical protein
MQLPENTLELVDKAIASVEARLGLSDREEMRRMLRAARAEAERALETPLRIVNPAAGEADLALSLVLSAANGVLPMPPDALFGILPGEDLDPGWIGSLYNYLHAKRVPFPTHDEEAPPGQPGSGVVRVADSITIAMAGDWGIGNASSAAIAEQMRALHPSYTIHLGDVYYSGTPIEERERFTAVWPAGREGALALDSNHEMYSGGQGYFSVALADPKFSLQRGLSYFALENAGNIVFGLDSAYPSHAYLYEKGELDPVQLRFLSTHAARARAAGKRVIVLTHHQPVEMDGSLVPPLCDQVAQAVGSGDLYWYWGHIHGAAVLRPRVVGGVTLHGRCIGHGGIPYKPLALTRAMEWTETERAGDPEEPRRALNGFARLRLDGDELEETLLGEDGSVRYAVPAVAAR